MHFLSAQTSSSERNPTRTPWLLGVCSLLLAGSAWLSGCAAVASKPGDAPQIAIVPASVDFKNVVVGQKNTQTIQISNTGEAALNVSAVQLTGTGFSLSSLAVPLELAPGATKNFTLSFSPKSASTVKGTINIVSDDPTSPTSIAVQGTGEKTTAAWDIAPDSLNMGNTTVQTTITKAGSIKNTGNTSVTVNNVSVSGTGFGVTGLASGLTLSPGQQVNFQITFRPTAAGNVSGNLSVKSSNASALTMALAGTGEAASNPGTKPHSVSLNWNPSSSDVSGYRIYRGTSSGGPYTRISSSLIGGTEYTDGSVSSGKKYYYVATSVTDSGDESPYSNEVSASIPSN